MMLNKKKCGIMTLSRKSTLSKKELMEKDILGIPYVPQYKYLGVIISKNLKFEQYIEKIKEKSQNFKRMSYILRKNNARPKTLLHTWKLFM